MSLKPLKKAVLPVAGLGTRFLPATKALAKEMLPVVDKPLIQYAVDEARDAFAARRIVEAGILAEAGRPLSKVIRKLREHIADEKRAIAGADAATFTPLSDHYAKDRHRVYYADTYRDANADANCDTIGDTYSDPCA